MLSANVWGAVISGVVFASVAWLAGAPLWGVCLTTFMAMIMGALGTRLYSSVLLARKVTENE